MEDSWVGIWRRVWRDSGDGEVGFFEVDETDGKGGGNFGSEDGPGTDW